MSVVLSLKAPPAVGTVVWRCDGLVGTVAGVGERLLVRVDGERTARVCNRGERGRWMPAVTCDYCDRPARVQLIDGQPGDVLCRRCARDQFDHLPDWVRPIPRSVIRELYQQYAARR